MNTPKSAIFRKTLTFIVMAAIIGGGLGLSYYWLENKPKAQRKPFKALPPLVEAEQVTPKNYRVVINALGTVKAAQSVDLSAQVSGEVIEVSERLRPGARFEKGELIALIDPADFELALRQKEADLVKARTDLELELGQQAIAKREYELFGETIEESDRALLLREPHLKSAQAKVDAAEAAVEQARLNLERTRVVAPFNALIQSRSVSIGTQLGSGSKVATLIDTDRYWIEATLTAEQLSWIRYDDNGSKVTITPRNSKQEFPVGTVMSIMGDVAEKGRMARAIVEVPKPLDEGSGVPLLLNDLVSLSIEGIELKNVIAVPRSAVHNGNTIWLLTPEKSLKIVTINPIWSTKQSVYLPAETFEKEQQLIISNLPAPVEGMTLRTRGDSDAKPAQ